ncbi:MAG: hypothetical protein WBQ44_06365, partial [Rhodococcus sp. (in: high G+C Gram-positive bacteria)]
VLYVSAGAGDKTSIALYLGAVAFTMLMTHAEEIILSRAGFRVGGSLSRRKLWIRAIPLGLILVALIVALSAPALGLWPVLIMVLGRPVSGRMFRGDATATD